MERVLARVEERMTAHPAIAQVDMPAKEALASMSRHGFRHLPVVEGDEVVGIVSERDLLRMEVFLKSMHLLVSDVMSRDPYVVRVGTPLVEVVREMAREKLGSAVIVNGRNAVVGIFTTTDGMKVLCECLESGDDPRSVESAMEDYFGWEA